MAILTLSVVPIGNDNGFGAKAFANLPNEFGVVPSTDSKVVRGVFRSPTVRESREIGPKETARGGITGWRNGSVHALSLSDDQLDPPFMGNDDADTCNWPFLDLEFYAGCFALAPAAGVPFVRSILLLRRLDCTTPPLRG